jgi:hypothetical protein
MNKNELKRQYKQTIQPMGVYQIKNLVNGKIFIDTSKNLHGQLNSDRFQLKAGSHMNRALQNDFTQLGEDKFVFEVMDYLEPKNDPEYDYTQDLKVLLDMWLEKIQAYEPKGYHKKPVP